MKAPRPSGTSDLAIHSEGSVILIDPRTSAGRDWLNEHIDMEEAQVWSGSVVAEPRYVESIVQGAVNDGLTVRFV